MSHYGFAGVAAPFFLRVRTAMTMHRTDGLRALLAGALPRLHGKAPILRPIFQEYFPCVSPISRILQRPVWFV